MRKVILASASPRRHDLLARIVYPYTIVPANIDESLLRGESPTDYVHRPVSYTHLTLPTIYSV